jgi:hypothetical protein
MTSTTGRSKPRHGRCTEARQKPKRRNLFTTKSEKGKRQDETGAAAQPQQEGATTVAITLQASKASLMAVTPDKKESCRSERSCHQTRRQREPQLSQSRRKSRESGSESDSNRSASSFGYTSENSGSSQSESEISSINSDGCSREEGDDEEEESSSDDNSVITGYDDNEKNRSNLNDVSQSSGFTSNYLDSSFLVTASSVGDSSSDSSESDAFTDADSCADTSNFTAAHNSAEDDSDQSSESSYYADTNTESELEIQTESKLNAFLLDCSLQSIDPEEIGRSLVSHHRQQVQHLAQNLESSTHPIAVIDTSETTDMKVDDPYWCPTRSSNNEDETVEVYQTDNGKLICQNGNQTQELYAIDGVDNETETAAASGTRFLDISFLDRKFEVKAESQVPISSTEDKESNNVKREVEKETNTKNVHCNETICKEEVRCYNIMNLSKNELRSSSGRIRYRVRVVLTNVTVVPFVSPCLTILLFACSLFAVLFACSLFDVLARVTALIRHGCCMQRYRLPATMTNAKEESSVTLRYSKRAR